MMIPTQLANLVRKAIVAAQEAGELPPFDPPEVAAIPVERPNQPEHGDFATPIALQLARQARRAPRQIAQALVDHWPAAGSQLPVTIEIAGAGFINFRLQGSWLVAQIDYVLVLGQRYADLDVGKGRKAQVEFVSANPTGPLTVGHGRGAVIGDTLSNLLEAGGFAVTREYYFNDGGLQMRNLAESVRLRARELLGEEVSFPENYYVGDYIKDIASDLVRERGPEIVEADWTVLRDTAVDVIFADIRQTLGRLGVHFTSYVNEMAFFDEQRSDNIWTILVALRERDLAYDADKAVWFRATRFGADKDRVLVRSTGEPTYRLPDIAYHADKLKRGFDLVVDVLGSDHIAQHPDIKAALAALGAPADRIQVVTNQFVTLVRDGEIVKMSTRRATYVTLDELIDDVGSDAVRYFMISRAPESQFEFDLNLAKAQSDDNPVYYIQYAHARCAGILDRTAPQRSIAFDAAADLRLLQHPAELALIKEILRLQEVIAIGIERLEPHPITYYARDLATVFNVFYRDCHVLDEEHVPLSQARLKLVKAAQMALARALGLMGMSAPAIM